MRTYIKKLQSKNEETRKQIFAGIMIGSMLVVSFVWIYSLGVRFGGTEAKAKVDEDIKPFKLFSNSISETYKNISGSVGNAPSLKESQEESKLQKQIDLIPVEYTNQ